MHYISGFEQLSDFIDLLNESSTVRVVEKVSYFHTKNRVKRKEYEGTDRNGNLITLNILMRQQNYVDSELILPEENRCLLTVYKSDKNKKVLVQKSSLVSRVA